MGSNKLLQSLKRNRRPMKMSSWTLTMFVCMFYLSHSQGQKLSPTYHTKISMGAIATEVKGPIFYETYTSLIYEYQVPIYSNLDITLRDWRGKCDSDSYTPSYTCPVFYHFERFLERFEKEVVPKAWYDPVTNRTTSPSSMMDNDDFCDKIQMHFKASLTVEYEFEEYVEKLKQCLPGVGNNVVIERQISDYVYNIKALFKKMNENYENEFSNKFFGETNKKIGPAFYVNAVTSHQNGMLIAYLQEKARWTSAISACQQQRVPETLLKPQNVTKNLKTLNQRLAIGNQQTAVNVNELSTIFKLPLTDCSFIERTGHFVVRILIPVIRKDISPKLYKVTTFPFLLNDKICQLHLSSEKKELFLYDETVKNLQYSECTRTDRLCQVKEFEHTVTDLCLRAVFLKDHYASKKYCGESFKCLEIGKGKDFTSKLMKLPIVQKIYPDAWVVFGTGNVSDKMTIKCEGSTAELKVDLTQDLSGALEIRLPCRCHIVFNSELLYPTNPCSHESSQPPEIRQILPPQFMKEEFLSAQNSNNNVTLKSFDLPSLNEESSNKPSAQTQDHKTVEQPENNKNPVELESPQLGLLWTLVIFQLVLTMSIIVFGVYRYAKYKKELSYSKERLVYNIYPSPSDSNIPESSCNSSTSGAYKVTTTPISDYRNHL